jgi:hypothetical protein
MRADGANILAPGLPSSGLHHRPDAYPVMIGFREVVSSYSSATASGFHGIPRAHLLCLTFVVGKEPRA